MNRQANIAIEQELDGLLDFLDGLVKHNPQLSNKERLDFLQDRIVKRREAAEKGWL